MLSWASILYSLHVLIAIRGTIRDKCMSEKQLMDILKKIVLFIRKLVSFLVISHLLLTQVLSYPHDLVIYDRLQKQLVNHLIQIQLYDPET